MRCSVSVDPKIRKRWGILIIALSLVLAGFGAGPAHGSIIQKVSGVSISGVPVSCEAHLMITGDVLTIVFYNTSPVHSQNPSDVCASYYFDIYNGANVRPVLTYQSATGNVWLANKNNPDTLQTANANLKAVASGDHTWQFKNMNAAQSPFLGFGLGTVGNNDLTPNDFMVNIVGNIDYSLYAGDVTTPNLNSKVLVKDHITFTFTGLTGFTEDDISPAFAVGLGTRPDSLLLTPEPATIVPLLGVSLFGLHRRVRRRRVR